MLDGRERLVKPDRGLAIGRAREGLHRRLPQVAGRLIPELAVESVSGEPFDVLTQPLRIEPFEGLHDPGLEPSLLFSQQRVVGDATSQPVLEDVVWLLEEADVVEELGGAQASQGLAELVFHYVGDRL